MAAGYATQAQAYQALIAAGAPTSVAQVLAAVTRPESSGYTAARNDFEGNSYLGLWQVGSMHGFDNARLQSDDIAYQAMAAYKVYQEQGFGAWETYTNGSYLQYMGGSANSAPALGDMSNPATLTNAGTGVTGVPGPPPPTPAVQYAPGHNALDGPDNKYGLSGFANPIDGPTGSDAGGVDAEPEGMKTLTGI